MSEELNRMLSGMGIQDPQTTGLQLMDLPDEVLLDIFKMVPPTTSNFAAMLRVNKRFKSLTESKTFSVDIIKKNFPLIGAMFRRKDLEGLTLKSLYHVGRFNDKFESNIEILYNEATMLEAQPEFLQKVIHRGSAIMMAICHEAYCAIDDLEYDMNARTFADLMQLDLSTLLAVRLTIMSIWDTVKFEAMAKAEEMTGYFKSMYPPTLVWPEPEEVIQYHCFEAAVIQVMMYAEEPFWDLAAYKDPIVSIHAQLVVGAIDPTGGQHLARCTAAQVIPGVLTQSDPWMIYQDLLVTAAKKRGIPKAIREAVSVDDYEKTYAKIKDMAGTGELVEFIMQMLTIDALRKIGQVRYERS